MARSANRVDVQLKAPRSESQRNKLVRDHTDVLSKGSSIRCQSMGLSAVAAGRAWSTVGRRAAGVFSLLDWRGGM